MRAHAANESNSGINSRDLTGRSIQPKKLAASVPGPQIVESFCAKRFDTANRSFANASLILESSGPESFIKNSL